MNVTIIYHNADWDGKFSGAIAEHFFRKHNHEIHSIGWDYGEPLPDLKNPDLIVMTDISVPELLSESSSVSVFWIDHHKSAMDRYPRDIPGLRINGIAACRLAYYIFLNYSYESFDAPVGFLRQAQAFASQQLIDPKFLRSLEPYLITLVGEYDVWDHTDPNTVPVQYGLKSMGFNPLHWLPSRFVESNLIDTLRERGSLIIEYERSVNADLIKRNSRVITFHGLKFLVMNWPARNSLAFGKVDPEIDGLMSWYYTGNHVRVSLYGVPDKPDIYFSLIANHYAGGGHKQACGFQCNLSDISKILRGQFGESVSYQDLVTSIFSKAIQECRDGFNVGFSGNFTPALDKTSPYFCNGFKAGKEALENLTNMAKNLCPLKID